MPDDKPLKSAYELAMERLRARDREEGREEPAALTDAQKAEIAELRRETEAKLAELDILKGKRLRDAGPDPVKRAEVESQVVIDRRRIEERLDSAIARVRRGKPGKIED